MKKEHILHEIRRTAQANGGKPLGTAKFTSETGIKVSDWFGVYWARWGDALREAGFAPNQFNAAHGTDVLLQRYADLTRELRRLPVSGDLRLKAKSDPQFPSHNTFNRLGKKSELIHHLLNFCRDRKGYESVMALCEGYTGHDQQKVPSARRDVEIGFVYLLKSGRFYKIGKSNAAGRREYELSLQLPERAITVHVIRTDDPFGIETYWHKRFEAQRKNGEWFDLGADEVAAFKRRKFM